MFKFDLQSDEKLVEMIRQTELVLVKPALLVLALIYIPWYFLIKYGLQYDYRHVILAWTVIVLLYAINKYLLWLLNVYILTDRRIIQVSYTSLFRKRVEEGDLENIIGAGIVTTGVLSSLAGYGDIELRFTHSSQPLILNKVRNPRAIKNLIWNHKPKIVSEPQLAAKTETKQQPEQERCDKNKPKKITNTPVQAKIRKIV